METRLERYRMRWGEKGLYCFGKSPDGAWSRECAVREKLESKKTKSTGSTWID